MNMVDDEFANALLDYTECQPLGIVRCNMVDRPLNVTYSNRIEMTEDLRRNKQMMDEHIAKYHEAFNSIRADYIQHNTLDQIDMKYRLTPKKIIHNGPATVVIWRDGEKTVVKLMDGDTYDEYAAFTAALAKKIFGSTGYVKRMLKDVTVEQIKKDPEFKSWKEWAEHINNLFNDALAKAYSNKD